MKKTISAILLTAMLAAMCMMGGCSLKKENTPKPVVTPEPTPAAETTPAPTPAPETTPATVLTDDLPATALKLDEGTEVEVSSESGD